MKRQNPTTPKSGSAEVGAAGFIAVVVFGFTLSQGSCEKHNSAYYLPDPPGWGDPHVQKAKPIEDVHAPDPWAIPTTVPVARPKATVPTEPPPAPPYTFLRDERRRGVKRVVAVRLFEPVSEATVEQYARNIIGLTSDSYNFTQIDFLLHDMTLDAGAWAIARLDSQLTVKIVGLTMEDYRALASLPPQAGVKTLGIWMDTSIPSRVTAYVTHGKYIVERMFAPNQGRPLVEVCRASKVKRGLKLTPLDFNGDYFIITKDGRLEDWDNAGMIRSHVGTPILGQRRAGH